MSKRYPFAALSSQSLLRQRRRPAHFRPQADSAPARGSLPTHYHLMQYGGGEYTEIEDASLEQVLACKSRSQICWIDVEGIGDVEAIQQIGQAFGLHPLAIEDVINVHQRPKMESYQDLLFVVARMPHPEAIPATEQVAIFLGPDFLITFQEGTPGDCFEPVRKHIRENSGRLRHNTPGNLLYALLDTLVDQFFPELEFYADLLANIEDRIIAHRYGTVSTELYTIRRHLLLMHRIVRPLQDVINSLMREPLSIFDEETRWYLRDVYDHTTQLMDMLETYKDLSTHLMEMASTAAGARMNEIMRFLTVMSSIFIPLTFIAGIYGMNFNPAASALNMPELNWAFGYPFSLLLMLGIAVSLMLFFRHKGWMGVPESEKYK